MGRSRWLDPVDVAASLVEGARLELDLTPKPGLVDRRDNGSHADLTYERMARSIDLLPVYFEELISRGDPMSLDSAIRIGREAEQRMFATITGNAHKGYIFLGGVVLLATLAGPDDIPALRAEIGRIAARFFERVHPGSERGGIRAEAMSGMPAVFDVGLPAYEDRLRATGDQTIASFDLMARLMMCMDDTTATRRCGPSGLDTLRADGMQLLRIIDSGDDPTPHLTGLNEDYRRRNLTMGGVADCMALTFAMSRCLT